jgi:N-acetylglutamate synthase-like GNAT family acetyltransferase
LNNHTEILSKKEKQAENRVRMGKISEMIIRKAEKKDYASIMALYRQLQPDDPVVDESKGKPVFGSIIESESNSLIIAEINNSVVSSCYLNIIPNLTRNVRPYAVIENVITDLNYRNRGIGKAIMQYAINQAWEAGCYKVMLLTGRKEESTLEFYRSCGLESSLKTAFIVKHT